MKKGDFVEQITYENENNLKIGDHIIVFWKDDLANDPNYIVRYIISFRIETIRHNIVSNKNIRTHYGQEDRFQYPRRGVYEIKLYSSDPIYKLTEEEANDIEIVSTLILTHMIQG